MTLVQVSETALRVGALTLSQAHQLRQRLLAQPLAGVVEVVPGLTSLLVVFDPQYCDLVTLRRLLTQPLVTTFEPCGRCHQIAVCYNGIDLETVAARVKLTVDEVIKLHLGATYQVAMLGFSPGFPYLVGLPGELHLPRRAQPRTQVAAGSVAIADAMTAIYPHASPGGWHIIGHTSQVLFDAASAEPSLLLPGDRVRFVRQ